MLIETGRGLLTRKRIVSRSDQPFARFNNGLSRHAVSYCFLFPGINVSLGSDSSFPNLTTLFLLLGSSSRTSGNGVTESDKVIPFLIDSET